MEEKIHVNIRMALKLHLICEYFLELLDWSQFITQFLESVALCLCFSFLFLSVCLLIILEPASLLSYTIIGFFKFWIYEYMVLAFM